MTFIACGEVSVRLGMATWNPVLKLAAWTGWLPTPLLMADWGMMSSRALIAAVELGVFDALSSGPKTAAEMASKIGCGEVGTESLLNALNGFGYVRRRGGTYRNARVTARWLRSDSRFPLVRGFGLFRVLWSEMEDMEDRLRSDTALDFHRPERDEGFWRSYEAGLAEFSKITSAEIVRRVRLDRPPTRLLDVGGGHGAYSAAFCRRYDGLVADVLDLPGAAAVGRQLLAEAGMSERVRHREGDLITAEWGEGYDVVLLFNVVHVLTSEQAGEVVRKARVSLRAGGTVVLLDAAHRSARGDIDTTGGSNELRFFVLNGTRAYAEADMAGWMRKAGFANVRVRHLVTVPQHVMITGSG